MHRDGGNLYLTPRQADQYSMPEVITVDSAIRSAVAFEYAARRVQDRTESLQGEIGRQAVQRRNEMQERVRVLGLFIRDVTRLCPVELTELAIQKLTAEPTE